MDRKRWILLAVLILALAAATVLLMNLWRRDRPTEVTVTTESPAADRAAQLPGQSLDLTQDPKPEDAALQWGLSPVNLAGGCVMAQLDGDVYYIRGDMLRRVSGSEDTPLFDAKMVCCSDGLVYTLGSETNDIFVYDPAAGENRALGLLSDTVLRVELDGEPLYLYEQNVRAMVTAGRILFLLTVSWDEQAQDLRFSLSGYDLADGCRRVYLRTDGNPSSMTYADGALYVGLKDEKKLLRVDAETLKDKLLRIPVPAAMAGADEKGLVYFTDDSQQKGGVYYYDPAAGRYNLTCQTHGAADELYGNLLILPDGTVLERCADAAVYLTDSAGRSYHAEALDGMPAPSRCGMLADVLSFPEEGLTYRLGTQPAEQEMQPDRPVAPTPGESV